MNANQRLAFHFYSVVSCGTLRRAEGNTKATILGSNKTFTCKQSGNDCVIDLSQTKPGEIPAEMFVVKLSGVEK
ncbi:MAG TPA: hypothetical protein VH396_21990 [Chitinophagaceae bacterium]